MKRVLYRSKFSFPNTSLLLVFLFLTFQSLQIYPQQISEEEKAGIIARNFLNQSDKPEDNGMNSPEAIQQKFFNGYAAGDNFGYSISTAGDVNGDGYSDVIVGAQYNDAGGSNAGRAYIFFGGASMDNTADVILTGSAAEDNFGVSVFTAGDVNADGYSDVIVGANLNDAGGADAGRAYIYFGDISMDNTADVILTGAAAGDYFGYSVSTAGDVNGDGYSDVIVGALLNDTGGSNAGRTYIFFGGASMDNTADVILTGAAVDDRFGNSVSAAGDVNGDGYDDVIVGANRNDAGGTDAGRAYIYLGGASMDNTEDVILTGAAAEDRFGNSVSIAGDVNGDGYSDVIVGANRNDAGGTDAGRAYIYLGGASMDNTEDVILTGAAAEDRFGILVATTGDMNGDGYADVIVGALNNDAGGSDAGRAYIYFGGTNMNNIVDAILTGVAANDYFGFSVSAAGDVNGDGYMDVLVGAYGNDAGGSDAGRAYLYTNSLTGADIPDEFFTGAAADDRLGYSVSIAGDVNGDGYSDVIVGAILNDAGGVNAGRAYIYFGGVNMNNTADVILTGAVGDFFGVSVSTAGDVNGDGYSDVIVGAYGNDAGGADAGRAYIYFGGASMDSTKDVILTGAAAFDYFGNSVSTAGDVNGDGYSDVIVGANLNDAGGIDAGRAYIYFGGTSMNNTADIILTGAAAGDNFGCSVSTSGDVNSDGYFDVNVGARYATSNGRAYIYYGGVSMDNTADVTLTGAAADDWFGNSVSTAGDVNGDGYSDVIVGAPQNDASGTDAGRAYVYFGGATMNNTADVTLTGVAAYDNFGVSVSTAGDVNEDGYSDVIVGSQLNHAGGINAGKAYIFLGGASMDNTEDVILTGAVSSDYFGFSVSTAGDVNGDGYSDVIVGSFYNDAGGISAGRAYLYFSSSPPTKPRIMSVKDVTGDQGGRVHLKWTRSGYDIAGINLISGYLIERSLPPGIIGFAWERVTTILPGQNAYYLHTADTWSDSSSNNSGTIFFRVTAQTSNSNVYWRSNIMSGHSVDNLSPALVKNFNGTMQGINNKLSWKANTEPDLKNYHIYRAFTSTINPDTCTAVLITTDTTGLDLSVPPGDSYYFIRARDIHDNFGPLAQINTPLSLQQINFTALIEGLYNSGSNTSVEDTVTVLLKNTSAPYTTIDQSKVKLNTSGNGFVKFRQAVNGTSYYLVIKHRNSIETWSKLGQQFTNSEMIYDFTTSANKAFGDNMKLKGSKWTIFSGDVNQDGAVDLADITLIDNDSYNFVTGYVPTDLNGNGSVEALDMNIVDNNSYNFVTSVTPNTLAKPKKQPEVLTTAEQE